LYRTNVAWESSDNFIDFQKKRSFLFAPSISYLPTDKTRINIDLVGSFSNDDSGINRGIPVLQNDLFALPISFTATEPFDNRQGSNTILTTSASHKFSDFLTLNASYTRSDLNEDFIETRSNNDFTADGTELIRLINDRITEGSSDFITAYLVGNFKTGAVKHKALLGLDYYEESQTSTTRIAIGEVNGVPNLSFGNRQPVASISELDNLNFDPASTNEFILGSLHRGFYIQDLFEVGKFKILAALRYEELKNRTGGIGADVNDAIEDGVLLPRLGITYSLNDNVNVYASYTEGFELIEIPNILTTVTAGEEFDPFESDQIEVGTKINLFKDKLLTQLSLYHINRSGRLLADSSGGAVVGFQLGEETSRGVEIEFTGNVTNNISLTANYAFNETEINESDLNSLRDFASDGLTNTSESNNPKHTAGLWAKYKFKNNNFLRNFDIGFGGNYVSESKLFDDSINAVNEFISIPDYVVINQRIGYRYKNIDASLNINNILDDRYFTGGVDAGRVFPGAPRNFLLTVGYQF